MCFSYAVCFKDVIYNTHMPTHTLMKEIVRSSMKVKVVLQVSAFT